MDNLAPLGLDTLVGDTPVCTDGYDLLFYEKEEEPGPNQVRKPREYAVEKVLKALSPECPRDSLISLKASAVRAL
jgi:hypothetical protein